jgi:recombination protein RecT
MTMSAQQRPESTAVAKRESRDKMEQLRARIEKFAPQLANVLPKVATPERVTTLVLTAATQNPRLLDCSPESILLSLMKVAQTGLEIGRTAYLVPYKGVCTFIPAWQGLVQLIEETGHYKGTKARAVYANEHFRYEEGASQVLEHVVMWDEAKRGELMAFYAISFDRHGRGTFEVLSRAEVDRIRAGSPSKNSDAWNNHYVEMGKKTAIRRLAKRLPQTSNRLTQAIEADAHYVEVGGEDDQRIALERLFSASAPPQSRAGRSSRALMAGSVPDAPYEPNLDPQMAIDGRPEARPVTVQRTAEEKEAIRATSEAAAAASDPYVEDRLIGEDDQARLGLTDETAPSRSAEQEWAMPFGGEWVGKPIGDVPSADLSKLLSWALKAKQSDATRDFIDRAERLLDDRRNGDATEPSA